jgi:hypothetical protein
LNYHVFRHEMIPAISTKKGLEEAQIIEKLSKCEGPHLHATIAVVNRFHDDKSTYTGAHAQGGPTFENNSGFDIYFIYFDLIFMSHVKCQGDDIYLYTYVYDNKCTYIYIYLNNDMFIYMI